MAASQTLVRIHRPPDSPGLFHAGDKSSFCMGSSPVPTLPVHSYIYNRLQSAQAIERSESPNLVTLSKPNVKIRYYTI
ncbi:hypothetical protein [Microcoleus sp. EPA2]|uniref:hypothetical protein n=1 Tax=Microcoleus sp. EPA2 TaxID=2841654 RepID=UPI00312BA168